MKSDVKILVFEEDLAQEGGLPPRVAKLARQYLANFGHYLSSEYFLFISSARTRASVSYGVHPLADRSKKKSYFTNLLSSSARMSAGDVC